ncbi:high-affinity zinc uptake system ATP-binding protein ZnuC [mine drainage metagenome]|uniref:High-affinity zinc uptake system ATP-binding protein ZnuC n=1 Tax=mine drainage metagenome TaxID=410659 RepID=A0A1J5SFN0_9ZZZZ
MSNDLHNIIRCRDVTARYGRVTALDGVSVDIPCGSLTAVAGPNGAGKSTLLKAILGWLRLTRGEIRIGDSHPQHVLPRLAYLPQRQTIDWDFPITVREVVEQGRYPSLGLGRRLRPSDHERIERALEELALVPLAARQIRMLSGGQQQRVFLARALAQGADIFLLDEPFNGLDRFATEELTHILLGWKAQGRTVVAAIHDIELARRHFEMGVLLATHLVAAGPVADALSEANLETAFLGSHCAHGGDISLVRTARFPS